MCVGVGKGQWKLMETHDDDISKRNLDNFKFVKNHKTMERCENDEVEFGLITEVCTNGNARSTYFYKEAYLE